MLDSRLRGNDEGAAGMTEAATAEAMLPALYARFRANDGRALLRRR